MHFLMSDNVHMDLKASRKSKGLTQSQAAEIAGVSLSSYKNHELGRSKMDSALGRMIAERIQSYDPYHFKRGVYPISVLAERIKEVFADREIDYAYLFGSYAKGTAWDESDVDLLIGGPITGLEYFSLGGALERALHKYVDVIRVQDILGNVEFLNEILSTGFRIYDKNKR
jgi:hypothetical protein